MIHSADNLIVAVENNALGMEATIPDPIKPNSPLEIPVDQSKIDEPAKIEGEIAENQQELATESAKTEVSESKTSEETDDYGNKVKKRVYTEEEVQNMIRDRLSRGRHAREDQPVQQLPQQPSPAASDANNPDNWQVELKNFVKQTLKEDMVEQKNIAMQRHEQAMQIEFESKFTHGMTKYPDFKKVVSTKPITDSMMLGTRNMNDPAAFIYAAAKTHPKELERISQITDTYAQIAEIGRLDERMKKARAVKSNAPAPISKTMGDVAERPRGKSNVDYFIQQDAKLRRR